MSYTAADITELDDVQHTRLRPAVNLGLDVLNTALREMVDNAVEEVADPSHGAPPSRSPCTPMDRSAWPTTAVACPSILTR